MTEKLKKALVLIGVGLLNVFHSILHFIQFFQSMLLFHSSVNEHDHDNFIDSIMHSPIFAILWGGLGVFTLYLGIIDLKNKKHEKIRNSSNV